MLVRSRGCKSLRERPSVRHYNTLDCMAVFHCGVPPVAAAAGAQSRMQPTTCSPTQTVTSHRSPAAGDFTVMVALRHDDVKVLEGLMDFPLRADKALASDVTVPVYRTLAGAVAKDKEKAAKETVLCGGERCAPLPVRWLHLTRVWHVRRSSRAVVNHACHRLMVGHSAWTTNGHTSCALPGDVGTTSPKRKHHAAAHTQGGFLHWARAG